MLGYSKLKTVPGTGRLTLAFPFRWTSSPDDGAFGTSAKNCSVSSLLAIQQVCDGDSGAACEKVKFTEGEKFGLATVGGAISGGIASSAGSSICLALGVSTGIGGVVCVAAIVGAGAWVGTTVGGMGGEYMGEKIYETTQP